MKTEVEEQIFGGNVGVVVRTSRVVKMKYHLRFYGEFSILCIEDIIVFDRVF